MSIVYVLLPASLLLAGCAVVAFIWAARQRQFEALEVAAARPLMEPDEAPVSEPAREPPPTGDVR